MAEIVLYVGPFVLVMLIALYAYTQTPKFEDDSALDEPIHFSTLRNNPQKVAKLAEQASSVGVIQIDAHSSSRSGVDRYEGFVVDTNGHPNTFITSEELEQVRREARWLAAQLDVPLNDRV